MINVGESGKKKSVHIWQGQSHNVSKSIHLLITNSSDAKDTQTEYLFHVYWTNKKVSYSLCDFF